MLILSFIFSVSSTFYSIKNKEKIPILKTNVYLPLFTVLFILITRKLFISFVYGYSLR